MIKLGADELRIKEPSQEEFDSIKRNPIYIIIDNVLDTYNVGAIFRLADAVAASGVYLVGQTAIPTDEKVGHKIHKASVGVWQWVPWAYTKTVKEAVEKIKKNVVAASYAAENEARKVRAATDLQIIAIEQHESSIPYTEIEYKYPVVFILGHETDGLSKESLTLADQIAEIPLFGVNKSLNVMVSLAIVMWEAIRKSK